MVAFVTDKQSLSHIVQKLRQFARPVGNLHADPANVRLHDERNVAAIAASLARFGQQKAIVVDDNGVCIAGSGTLEAARKLNWTHIAAVPSSLVGADRIAYAIADNRTAELAAWDDAALARQLEALQADPDADVLSTGFSVEDIGELLADLHHGDVAGGLVDADDIPAPPDEATTRPGDLVILGNHRLLCGDSGSGADVDRLLDGARVQLVNTDPPYNVRVEPRSNNAIAAGLSSFAPTQTQATTNHQSFDVARQGSKKPTDRKLRPKDRPLANDFVTDEQFDKMLHAWFGNIARVLEPGRSFYIWGGYSNLANYPPVLKAHELYFSQAVVWAKGHPVLTRKDMMTAYEIGYYGWRLGAGHDWFGPNNVTDLWEVKKVNPASMIHLTEKPVELAVRAIGYSSRPGENVLDLFGGSGSTLIGCEQTGRRAFLMELDALYCDVIIGRWERFTGKKAERRPADVTTENTPAEQPAGAKQRKGAG